MTVHGRVPKFFRKQREWQLSAEAVVQGPRYRGNAFDGPLSFAFPPVARIAL
jgi:hypothetical protein